MSNDQEWDDVEYQHYLSSVADECQCCRACGGFGIPCDGIAAGGLCDRMCRCSLEDEP